MKTATTETLALLFGVVLAAMLAACAARSQPRAASAPESHPGDAAGADQSWTGRGHGNEDIAALDEEIAHDLAQLGIDAPTDDDVISATVAHAVPPLPMSTAIADSCPTPPSGNACDDVCTLADSICSNAGRICTIAEDLANDEHATQRCTAGKLSCDRASARCCGCS
jgi:hypothetical protein